MGKIETAVQWIIDIANDNKHGYDQINRWGPDYDCSSLVISAWEYAGIPVKAHGAYSTYNMKPAFLACGFSDVSTQVNLITGNGLKRGDVLLNIQAHTVMYIGNGKVVSASLNEFGNISGGKTGDQNSREIRILPFYSRPWDCALRYIIHNSETITQPAAFGNSHICQGQIAANYFIGSDISVTGIRDAATKKHEIKVLQKAMNLDYGAALDVDGIWGPATENTLKNHYTAYGENQYLVTACEILLLTHGLKLNGVEYPGFFGNCCLAAVKKFQTDNKLFVTGICDYKTFLRLVK